MEAKVLENIVELYRNNKISHAYLIETNNLDKCFLDLKKVIKQIFCVENYADNCSKCNICNLVDQGYLPSFYVIEPSGSTIKKEQVLELKRAFSTIPIYTNDNIYVIKRAEALTDASANTMLKFVEEPEEHIIGFFITNNINNVISTIRSRCEVLKVLYPVAELDEMVLNDADNKEMLDTVKNYLEKLEVEKSKSIMYNRDVLLCKYTEREDIKKIFNIILIIYKSFLNKALGLNSRFDLEEFNFLNGFSLNALKARVQLVIKFIDDIGSNVNIELLLDKFVIELSDIDG